MGGEIFASLLLLHALPLPLRQEARQEAKIIVIAE